VLVQSIPPTMDAAMIRVESGIGFELFIFTDRQQLMGNRIGNVTLRIELKGKKKQQKLYEVKSSHTRVILCCLPSLLKYNVKHIIFHKSFDHQRWLS
jgi:hypothetical protein